MLTQDKFTAYKADYSIYKHTATVDQYGNEQDTYSDVPSSTMHVMWSPVSDEAAIEIYGEDVRNMRQCVLYEDVDIDHMDRVQIGTDMYEVVSIQPYNTHLQIRVRLV